MPATLTSIEKKALEDFKAKLLKQLKEKLLAVKLFGSKARGDSKKNSDIDVLVLVKEKSQEIEDKIFDIATQILLKHGIDLSIKIFSGEEFQKGLKLEIPLYIRADKEGIPV